MKNQVAISAFRLFNDNNISFAALQSILLSVEMEKQSKSRKMKTLAFRFCKNPLIYTIRDLEQTIYGYHRDNKKLLHELIEEMLKTEELEVVFN